MANFTVAVPGIPNGTTVGAYPVSRWREDQLPPSGAPIGAAINTQVVAGGSVTFTGLTTGVDYFCTDATGIRYYRFTVGADTPVTPGSPGTNSVETGDLQDQCVTTAKLADGSVTSTKLASALTAALKGYVNHGATAGTARPSGFASIEWVGSVAPTNAIDGDTWIDTTT